MATALAYFLPQKIIASLFYKRISLWHTACSVKHTRASKGESNFLKIVEDINMMKVAKTGSNLLGMLVMGMGSMGLAAAASAVDLGVGANVGVQTPHVDVQTQGNAGTSAGGARVEGTSDARVNTHENLNRNDQKLPDANRGMERAQERMNAAGAEHEQATTVTRSRKNTWQKRRSPPLNKP